MNTVDYNYAYHNYERPDPAHQPFYLDIILARLRADSQIHNVLDAGCGDGNFTASVSEAGYEMYGIDNSEGGIGRAKQEYPRIKFMRGSVYDDLASLCGVKCFDAIICIEVIEHLYNPRQFVKRAFDSLRPGGILIVTTPYWGYFKNVTLALSNRIDRALTALWDGGHIKHWSFKTLRQLLIEQGFEYMAFYDTGRKIPYL